MTHKLSSHQERLWFIDRFETGNVYTASPTYHNIPMLLQGSGDLDAGRVTAALGALVARHGALRTRIVTDSSEPMQLVCVTGDIELPVRNLGADAKLSEAVEAAVTEAKRPFVPETDVLLRATLLRFGADGFLLVVVLHHMIADKPSLATLTAEFGELMRAGSEGRAPNLAPPALHYADYATWQRSLSAKALEPLLFYWKWQLRGQLAALELPAARPRPAVHTFTAARYEFVWDAALGAAIRDFAAREGSEPQAVTLAAFKVLLHRYARQDEIVIGTSEACREQPGTGDLVGPVSNLVVLRSQLGGNPTFRGLLGEVTRTMRQGRAHQEMPFDSLVLALNPDKDMSRTALFDVHFKHDEAPFPGVDLGAGLTAQLLDTNLGFGKYDLNLALRTGVDGTVTGALVYNADFHDAWFIAQLMRHFERLVRVGVEQPETGIDDLPLLEAAEERRVLFEWNDTAAAAPREKTLAELFAAQALRTPRHIAVGCGDAHLTYAELDSRANRVAHHLRAQGVGSETLVAVCIDRSIDLVVALLAVLKAGGAYLPLDPSYPRERLSFTLRDAHVEHLVTTAAQADCISLDVTHVTRLDLDAPTIATQSDSPAVSGARPENLAYCIYTSGSTGQPKGALIENRQVVRLMINDRAPFAFGPTDVWTMFHSCCFDFSVWEMYGALLFGGRLVIVPRAVAQDPEQFFALIVREGVTVLNQTPTSFYNFSAEALRRGAPPLALHTVIFGGEALHPLHLRDWRAAYPSVRLVNMYGITETTVHVTVADVNDDDVLQNRCNIGRPIPTTTTYLLDERLRPVPPGVAGEICVGGEGVGRGYLRRNELTTQRFIASPFRPDERLYRSGDLARHLPDGRMVYLGRIDDQVQIRGFRVELGEITTRLLQHPAIVGVEVVARTLQTDALELVAYIVSRGGVDVPELRRHLVETLPEYMVPAVFIQLPALPLTSNGKVDRRALPSPSEETNMGASDHVAPANPVEERLAALWAGVLQRERVSVRDNFFELGGHSLLATQLVARVREAFGVELPLRHVFEAPTVEAFAPLVAARLANAAQVKKTADASIPKATRRAHLAGTGS
jgi:amino acid adenylation domain-containing protein